MYPLRSSSRASASLGHRACVGEHQARAPQSARPLSSSSRSSTTWNLVATRPGATHHFFAPGILYTITSKRSDWRFTLTRWLSVSWTVGLVAFAQSIFNNETSGSCTATTGVSYGDPCSYMRPATDPRNAGARVGSLRTAPVAGEPALSSTALRPANPRNGDVSIGPEAVDVAIAIPW